MRTVKINSRVIEHLGRNLITTSDVAVMELVKNSIDAKAKKINLYVYSSISLQDLPDFSGVSELVAPYLGKPAFLVEDDGIGMTDDVLQNGFLTIGTNIKETEEGTLGEKGIGRLATQRLGNALLIDTCSADEKHSSFMFIDWNEVINGNYDVPDFDGEATDQHTRLWILGCKIEDFIENAIQFQQVAIDNIIPKAPVLVNRDLKSALNFIVLPFKDNTAEKDNIQNTNCVGKEKKPKIDFYFDGIPVDISFPAGTLDLAECVHKFRFEQTENDILHYEVMIKPWFAERVHRALVKPDAFNHLKQPHEYYADLIKRNAKRIENVLHGSLSRSELLEIFSKFLDDFYATDSLPEKNEFLESFVREKANDYVNRLISISPVFGSIYSFKQGVAVGDKIVIDSARTLQYISNEYTLKQLNRFLDDYNGIKLYRDIYRIGYLGNKESDWIKLQQYRTKGQQWYRFDLGNTVGYVSLSDPDQDKIQEISSRLDISENQESEAFKMLINIVFNHLFYELNRKANDIIKVLLTEEGLLSANIKDRVKKNDAGLKEMIRRNVRMQKALQDVAFHIGKGEKIDGTDRVALPQKSYEFVSKTLKLLDKDIREDSFVQKKTADFIAEVNTQLKAIEIESYNNYKLMANGLITETITHELHSVSKTGISPDTEVHFDCLMTYFLNSKEVPTYNKHVVPIRNSYETIASKLEEVGGLYSFLETTFIKRGTIDEFINQNIQSVIDGIARNLQDDIKNKRIPVNCDTDDLSWLVPKGVLLHVFYNLINNSIYWIDMRRKMAQTDPVYIRNDSDEILIESNGKNEIIVSDTGTGVSRKMEDILFEPLQSGKPFSQGRGMGLYIVKKLMNSFGGDITLLEDRNQYGNRYRFLLTRNSAEE